MRPVSRYQTRDNQLHLTEKDAKRHAEKLYGLGVSTLAHKLLQCDKYSKMQEFIDQNLDAFIELKTLKLDMECEKPEWLDD